VSTILDTRAAGAQADALVWRRTSANRAAWNATCRCSLR